MSIPDGYLINSYGDEVDSKQLRVYRVLLPEQDPLVSDFTILGFKKVSPSYERGRKMQADYKCPNFDELIVSKIFNDVRDEFNLLIALSVNFKFYNEDGTVGLEKTDIVKHYNKYEAETEERKRRERQIDYLVAGAKGSPIESNLNAIFELLADEVSIYKEQGNNQPMVNLLNSITYNPNAVTEEELIQNGMYYVLNSIPIPRIDDPNKVIYVIQSIKYQIGAITLTEIEAENV